MWALPVELAINSLGSDHHTPGRALADAVRLQVRNITKSQMNNAPVRGRHGLQGERPTIPAHPVCHAVRQGAENRARQDAALAVPMLVAKIETAEAVAEGGGGLARHIAREGGGEPDLLKTAAEGRLERRPGATGDGRVPLAVVAKLRCTMATRHLRRRIGNSGAPAPWRAGSCRPGRAETSIAMLIDDGWALMLRPEHYREDASAVSMHVRRVG